MDEAENIDPKYLEGFNQGYFLAKHAPDLANSLSNLKPANLRLEGIQHGIQEFGREQVKDYMPEWLKQDRLNTINKTNDSKEKDIDKDEYEIGK